MAALIVANMLAVVGSLVAVAELVSQGNAGSAVVGCALLALSVCNTAVLARGKAE